MSRQFDEYMADKFEYGGELYDIIDPTNIQEYSDALKTRETLEVARGNITDTSYNWDALKAEQDLYIQEYKEGLPSFSYTLLIKNLDYLCDKYWLHMKDLEDLIGISTSYLSRALNENSRKKISIDTIHKIAKAFNVDLFTLLYTDMTQSSSDENLIISLLNKLIKNTRDNATTWTREGEPDGKLTGIAYESLDIGLPDGDSAVYYRTDNDSSFYLADFIYKYDSKISGEDLLVIPFSKKESNTIYYDFLFYNEDVVMKGRGMKEIIFSTIDIDSCIINSLSESLYDLIKKNDNSVKLSKQTRKILKSYLK